MSESLSLAPAPGAQPLRGLPALVRYIGRPDEPATVDVLLRSRRERTARAAQAWLLCWGAAGIAIFIPLLHFLLVPAFAIAGPLVARARWQEIATVLSARGRCPGCGAAQEVALRLPARAEIPWRCTACGRPLVLSMDPRHFDPPSATPSSLETR